MSRLNSFLRGVRVLDLSSYLPGPLASLLLADMGAEVLKIESPRGDEMQRQGPLDAKGRSVFYEAVNAGKTVHRLDLKAPEERAAFLELVAWADVLIEGFRPGVMSRLGLDYATLRQTNPGLVYCAISGYGASSPLAQAAGHDGNYLASSGVLDRNGGAGGPLFFDPPVADTAGSLFAALAILGALRARDNDGLGCEIDLALADVPMPLQLFQIADYGASGTVPTRETSFLNGGAAYYHVYKTADERHVMLGAIEPKFWGAFCNAAGRPDWIARQQEPIPQTGLIADVAALLAKLTLAECRERFAGADCCFTPVLDLGEALDTPHHRARALVRRASTGDLQALFPAYVNGEAPQSRVRRKVHGDPADPSSAENATRFSV